MRASSGIQFTSYQEKMGWNIYFAINPFILLEILIITYYIVLKELLEGSKKDWRNILGTARCEQCRHIELESWFYHLLAE